MAPHAEQMAGDMADTSKILNHGTSRRDLSASSRTQRTARSSTRGGHYGGHGGRSSDTSTGSSLKIANWRVRRSDDSSGGSSRSSFVLVEEDDVHSSASSSNSVKPLFPRARLASRQASRQASQQTSRQTGKGKGVDSFSHGVDGPVGVTNVHGDANVARRVSTGSSASSFEVLRHSRLLERDDGKTTSLFELRKSSQNSSSSSVAEATCTLTPASSGDRSANVGFPDGISGNHSSWSGEEDRKQQLLAALGEPEATARRSPGFSLSSLVHDLQGLSMDPGPTHTTKDSRDMVGDEMTKPISRGPEPASCPTSHQRADMSGKNASSTAAALAPDEHTRFSRFLCKLNKKPMGHEDNKVNRDLDDELKKETAARNGQQGPREASSKSTIHHRRPIRFTGRRVNTESDFMVEYLPGSESHYKAERSTDSGSTTNNNKCNSLNPKAREFLSGRPLLDTNGYCTVQDGMVGFAGPSSGAECELKQAHDADDCHGAGIGKHQDQDGTTASPPTGCPPVLYPNYLRPRNVVGTCPGINLTSLGLMPMGLENHRPSRVATAGPSTTPAEAGMRREANKSDKGKEPMSFAPCAPPFIPRLAYMPIPCGTDGPSQGSIGSLMPLEPTAPLAPVRPVRPVPKPKTPNPKAQQAYEEYVEYRKMYEPGYALACKFRQQKRVERQTTQQWNAGGSKKSGQQLHV